MLIEHDDPLEVLLRVFACSDIANGVSERLESQQRYCGCIFESLLKLGDEDVGITTKSKSGTLRDFCDIPTLGFAMQALLNILWIDLLDFETLSKQEDVKGDVCGMSHRLELDVGSEEAYL